MFRALLVLASLTPIVLTAPVHAGKLDQLGWMAGHWIADGESHVEEVWTAPRAGSMTGMFRLVNSEKPRVLEYIVISEEKGGVFYRFKHFKADYGAWEGNGAPLTYRLMKAGKDRAVFKNTSRAKNQPAYISYQREKDGNLTILVGDAPGKADKGDSVKFVLTRQ